MGYEIKLLIGKPCLHKDELEKDLEHPFEAGFRTDWAIALLNAMADDPEELAVVFWGH